MLRRALLAVAVISYLSCVLYLSVLQRNDTDVSSLRKSQGRNVNIPHSNNEKLHSELLPNNIAASEIKINKPPPRVSAEDLSSKDLGKVENKNHEGSNLRGRRTVDDEENKEEEASESNDNENSEKLRIINADNHTKIIQYTEEKPNLKKVITFWQKLVSRSQESTTEKFITDTISTGATSRTVEIAAVTTKVPCRTTFKNTDTGDLRKSGKVDVKPTVDDDILGSEFDVLLSEYTSKETTRLQSSTPLTKSKPSLDDDSDIFNDLLNTPDNGSSEKHKFNAYMSKYAYEFKHPRKNYPIDNSQREKQNRKSIQRDKVLQDKFVQDFNNLEQNVLKKPTTQSSDSNEDDYIMYTTENNNVAKKKSVKAKFPMATMTPLPDVIKQLAENVKDLIIKDLDKHTTKKEATTAPTHFAGNKNYIVIEKIMELLQKFKTENNNDAASTTEMTKTTTTSPTRTDKRPKANKKVHKNKNNAPNPSYSIGYGSHKRIPAGIKLQNVKSQPITSIKYLPSCASSIIANGLKSRPITIQTNLLEIPPLGVPVSNPASIVRHNIIVSTTRPFVQNLDNYLNSYDMLIRNHQAANRMKMDQPSNLFENSNHKDEGCNDRKKKRVKNIHAHRIKDHDSIEIVSDDEVIGPMKKYKKTPTRYENVHGFHEKFENYQSHGDVDDIFREDCSKEDTPREPVKYIKRGNDAAFKKLLRSQQRVTDMLEQMLARSKNEDAVVVTT